MIDVRPSYPPGPVSSDRVHHRAAWSAPERAVGHHPPPGLLALALPCPSFAPEANFLMELYREEFSAGPPIWADYADYESDARHASETSGRCRSPSSPATRRPRRGALSRALANLRGCERLRRGAPNWLRSFWRILRRIVRRPGKASSFQISRRARDRPDYANSRRASLTECVVRRIKDTRSTTV